MRSIAAVALCFAVLPSFAQEKIAETIEVRVANIDVVATDRSGKPVAGLTKDDFELYENGKLQPITNFYEVRPQAALPLTVAPGAEASAPAPQSASATPAAAPVPADIRARRFIILVDQYSLEPMQRNSVLTALRKFVNTNMRPTDEMSVLLWARGLQVVTPLTSDKAEVLKGLESAASRSRAGMSAGQEDERARQQCRDYMKDVDETDPDAPQSSSSGQSRVTYRWENAYIDCEGGIQAFADSQWAQSRALVGDLKQVVTRFAGIDGRKVLVLAGASLPEHPGRQTYLWFYQQFLPYQKFIKKTQINPNKAFGQGGSRSQTLSITDVAHFANANGVTFYMIDAADTRDASSPEKRGLPDEVQNTSGEDFMTFADTASAFHTLAAITGGSALSNTQNFDYAFQTLERDLSQFYSIGYRPAEGDASDRKIVVKSKKPGVYVRARQTFTPKTPDQEMNDRVVANVFHAPAAGEWPVRLTAGTPEKNGDVFKLPVTVEMDPKVTFLPQDQKMVGGFLLYIVVGTKEGAMSKVTKTARKIELPSAAAENDFRSKPMRYTLMLSVRPGENIVSVGVVDQISSASGFARADVVAQ